MLSCLTGESMQTNSGGGIRNWKISTKKLGFISKMVVAFFEQWAKVVEKVHGLAVNGWESPTATRVALWNPWKGIRKILPISVLSSAASDNCIKTRFWLDDGVWKGSYRELFPHHYALSLLKEGKEGEIADIVQQSSSEAQQWNLLFGDPLERWKWYRSSSSYRLTVIIIGEINPDCHHQSWLIYDNRLWTQEIYKFTVATFF